MNSVVVWRSNSNGTDSDNYIQWNFDLTKYQGTEEMLSLYRGFVKSKTSIYRICMKIIQMFVISK